MIIDLRASDRLTGERAVDLGPVLSAVAIAIREGSLEPGRGRVVCDWVQYRHNFRNPVDVRGILPPAVDAPPGRCAAGPAGYEIAIDLRRAGPGDVAAALTQKEGRRYLEDWGPAGESCIWSFNRLYWHALGLWEQVTGQQYEQALPGGASDARNVAAAGELVLDLFRVWDDLGARGALPEDLHVLELGVGNGSQACVWLDEFRRLDRERGGRYYRRLHYLMGDYSPHVLERARTAVQHHAERVSTLVLDARAPTQTLGFLRFKAFLIYISNVYDNLPSDHIVRIGGHLFHVETRDYLSDAASAAIADTLGVAAEEVPVLVRKLLELGPELLAASDPQRFPGGPLDAVRFWAAAWEALRLEERYVPIQGLDLYEVAPGVSGEVLRPIVEANGDLSMHVSNGAAASFLDSLPLLHPFGVLKCHDLFVTESGQYRSAFRGPGKYHGSVVNWVNGPLLAALGRRHGFEVDFQPFPHRRGSNITTLTARVRE